MPCERYFSQGFSFTAIERRKEKEDEIIQVSLQTSVEKKLSDQGGGRSRTGGAA